MKKTPCMDLETKKLFVPALQETAFKENPEAGWEGHFWCGKTACEVGPDDLQVNLRGCSNPERSCYKTLE
jgi:hypothetical protein